MEKNKIKLSILILTYFSEAEIRACLDAVLEGALENVELIVVDNVSKDGTINILKNEYSDHPNIRIVFNAENTGFARGVNQAAALATGTYLLILNPDTVAPLSGIMELVEYMEHHPEVGVVGPRIVDEHGTIQESYGEDLTPWNELVGKTLHSKYAERIPFVSAWKKNSLEKRGVQDVGWIGGACMVIRRSLFESIGGIDTHFFFSHGDMVDLGVRVKKEGFRVVLYPEVSIVHTGSKSVAHDRDRALYEAYDGTLYFFRKHYGKGTVVMVKVVYVLTSLLKALISFPVSLVKRDPYRAIAVAHFKNACRIILGKI